MTGMPDAWTNPALMQARNGFIQGWEARAQHDVDATIIQYHEATIKRLEKRIEELAQPAQEPDNGDELTIAYMSGVHRGKELAAQPAQKPVSVTYKEVADAMNLLWNGTLEQHQIAEQMANKKLYTTPPAAQPAQEPDYAYPTIEEYEEITGFKVNDTFRMGWAMARTTNDLFKQMEKNA
jgi:hypothetical protein